MALSNLMIVEAPAGLEAELERRLGAFVLLSRQAEGCLSYDFYQSLESSSRFMLQIRWRDLESLERHLASAELQFFLAEQSAFLAASFAEAYRNFVPEDDPQK